jgi:hypothetical protein
LDGKVALKKLIFVWSARSRLCQQARGGIQQIKRPVNADSWVVPQQTALMLGALLVGGFIQRLGTLAGEKTVS